ncbi:MAG: EAL domain-containing protein [Alphaproteobacteria bacterium]|nr:EAL domain-containing protein [Alphaproteobacteria bacterium]
MPSQFGSTFTRIRPDVTSDSKTKKFLSKNRLTSSPSKIWKSRISWRITAVAFMTILLVQTLILNFGTIKKFEALRLSDLRDKGQSSIIPLIDPAKSGFLKTPFDERIIARLLATTKIKGLTVYGLADLNKKEFNLISAYGEPTVLLIRDENNLAQTYRSGDGGTYEFIFRSSMLSGSHYIVVRMDSSEVQPMLFNYVIETLVIMLFMSLFVTTVLMIALGHWLLEPILFMRDNLLAAFKNPEDPQIQDSPFDTKDEIGTAINIAQKLIHQNAENIKRIKSAAEDKIHKLAYFDTLTGLPNRTLFVQTLGERARQLHDGSAERFAIITLDLDHFKDINDSMGHNIGDAILRGVGKRLRAAMPESAMVSKMGEDEYAIMMPLSTDLNTARDVAERVIDVIRSEPFKVFNEQFQVRASVGVSTFPDDGTDPDQVLKNADIALNRAKEEGRDVIKEYSEDFDRAVQQRFQLLRDLRDAMENNQLQLFYQPQLDLVTGRVIGAEALLRWWKPDNSKHGGTFIPPNEFIPVAEQSGLIVPIGEWVIETACRTAKGWLDNHGIDIRIAINVSASQFSQSDICAYTQKIITETMIKPHRVELEVTESVFMDDIQHTVQTLQNLHAIGVELAIDDFGTGYSSLSYLRQFPIDRLKIDQSFIRNALNDPDDAAIARTIIALGRSLGLKVIAEGVETAEHEKFLVSEGCDEVQGYRYSRPVPEDQFLAFVEAYDGTLASFKG